MFMIIPRQSSDGPSEYAAPKEEWGNVSKKSLSQTSVSV